MEPARAIEESRDVFLTACHDVCAPLSAIHLQAQRLNAQMAAGVAPDIAKLLDFVTRAERLSLAAARLMREVLSDEPAMGGRMDDPAVDLEEALATAVSFHAEALLRARCSIVVTRDEGAPRLRGPWNSRALESIFSNLLQNVCRHAGGSPVGIRFSHLGSQAIIRFSDKGPGLPERPLAPGHQARQDLGRGGYGLGMWIVRRAVRQLMGEISVTSYPGRGVAFEIRLPVPG